MNISKEDEKIIVEYLKRNLTIYPTHKKIHFREWNEKVNVLIEMITGKREDL